CMHGGIYILMKTEGALHEKMRGYVKNMMIFFIMTYVIVTAATLIYQPHMTQAIHERPVFFVVALLNMFAIANIPREIEAGRDGRAFISSCFNIICLLTLFAIGSFPNVVRAINAPGELSLTIFNSSSSDKTLEILLVIAAIGVPMVVAYTTAIYWVFRGKVKLESSSY
ncbi:MAG: cytochrome d ubiquinol oxidase subunit II, partial [Parachlamydiaceae bacterium]